MRLAWTFGALLFLSLASCNWGVLPSTDYPDITLGEQFRVDIDQTVKLASTGYYLSFRDVPYDSRCPEGVACIWAGFAHVDMNLWTARGDSSQIRFQIWGTTCFQHQGVSIDTLGFILTLYQLEPCRYMPDTVWSRSDYAATMRITRSNAEAPQQ